MADSQHHRAVPAHERRECGLGGLIRRRIEAVQKLPVGETDDRAPFEKRTELAGHRT